METKKGLFQTGGKGGRVPSLHTNTHRHTQVYSSCIKSLFLILNLFFTSGLFIYYFLPHTKLNSPLASLKPSLDTPPSSFIHTSLLHLFLLLAYISSSPSLIKSWTASASSPGSALIAVCLFVSVRCHLGPLSDTCPWLAEWMQSGSGSRSRQLEVRARRLSLLTLFRSQICPSHCCSITQPTLKLFAEWWSVFRPRGSARIWNILSAPQYCRLKCNENISSSKD